MQFYFYILIFCQGRPLLYIEHTSEALDERLRKHNSDHDGFTGTFRDWQIVYVEPFHNKSDAYGRERQVKAWKSSVRIKQLIQRGSEHPDL